MAIKISNPSSSKIQDWMINYIADLLQASSDDIDTDTPFDRFGLDSAAAIGMTGELEDWLDLEIDPTLMYDYPTIKGMATYLEAQLSEMS
ncbi:MAG: acyl carrier protein [Cyanobacteria bacterium P01_E01_bin.45]